MDLTPIEPTSPELTIREPLCAVFRKHLKDLNQKYTTERAQILDALIQHDDIFEAEQLQAALRDMGYSISKATVYRTLKLLQEAGIIQRIALDADQAHYQLAYSTHREAQLVRVDTNETSRVNIPEIDAHIQAFCDREGLTLSGHRLHIYAVKK